MFLLIGIIFCLFITSIVFILLQQGIISFINPSKIYLPRGKVLHDLNILTYRNRTLYRYQEGQYIVLDEEEEFESVMSLDDVMNDVTIVSSLPHTNLKFSYDCRGICECFEDSEGDKRSASPLVFSRRYVSVILVSVLGFAGAKFVNDHIDDCYKAAREYLGDEVPFSCSMAGDDLDDLNDLDEADDGWDAIEDDVPDRYDSGIDHDYYCTRSPGDEPINDPWMHNFACKGHCLPKKFRNPELQKLADKFDCTSLKKDEKIVWIREEHLDVAHYEAIRRYQRLYLRPFCKWMFQIEHSLAQRERQFGVAACVSVDLKQTYSHIQCRKLDELIEIGPAVSFEYF